MKPKRTSDASRRRRDRLLQAAVHDPYVAAVKPTEPCVCRECGVVFVNGRWQWASELPSAATDTLCPACLRIRDRVPAGFLALRGSFLMRHRAEIVNLLHNVVDAQQKEHPLKRIMGIAEAEGGIELTFTDVHLPRSVGEAIERAYGGKLDNHFAEDSGIARVYWSRDD